MSRLINAGYGNEVNADKITAVIKSDAAPIKRMVQAAKDAGTCIDATSGKKCKAVIVLENGTIVLSPLLPETIAGRVNKEI